MKSSYDVTALTADVLIVGGGIIGLTLAKLLSGLGKVILIEKGPLKTRSLFQDDRVYAINRASENLFKSIGVWHAIATYANAYKSIDVWDEKTKVHVSFEAESLNQPNLGHFVSHQSIINPLIELLNTDANVQLYDQIVPMDIEKGISGTVVKTNRFNIHARLLIGCDGKESWLKSKFGILSNEYFYNQDALVCYVQSDKPHLNVARQKFNKDISLAFLPLSEANAYSIVLAAKTDYIKSWMSMAEPDFKNMLTDFMEHSVGQLKFVGQRFSYPLKMHHSKNYIKEHMALAGDSAHSIHPLAGLGLNLGLMDAACLKEILHQAKEKKEPFNHYLVLRRYERWCRTRNIRNLWLIEQMRKVFQNDNDWISALRSLGLYLSNEMLFLKKMFADFALGIDDGLPLFTQLDPNEIT